METVTYIFGYLYVYLDVFSYLLISSLGLIIILGMMGIINLAHGEFMMLGAYVAVLSTHAGIPFPISIIFATFVVGLFGILLERTIIRRFYGNLLHSLVVTWGISLVIVNVVLISLGPSLPALTMPLGGFGVGAHLYATYKVLLAVISMSVLVFTWFLFYKTKFGIRARAAMQNAEIARALGINTTKMFLLAFGLGSAFTGFAGAIYAPTTVITPFYGIPFLAPAFVMVVVAGGADVITGALITSIVLGVIDGTFSLTFATIWGRLALLIATMVILRLLPTGISGYIAQRSELIK